MFDGPRGEAYHLIGVRIFAPNDRDGLESLKSDLETAASRFQEYIDDAEAYWRAIHRFRHPDWPDDVRAKFKAEIERLRPIVEQQPSLPPGIYNCLSDLGRSKLKINESLISKKEVLAELRYLHGETSDALALILSRQPLSPPISAEQPTNDVKPNEKTVEIAQPPAAPASGSVTDPWPKALDSQAVGIAHEMLEKGGWINVAEVARRLGEGRTKLYRSCPAFSAMVRADRQAKTDRKAEYLDGPKHRRSRRQKCADDD